LASSFIALIHSAKLGILAFQTRYRLLEQRQLMGECFDGQGYWRDGRGYPPWLD